MTFGDLEDRNEKNHKNKCLCLLAQIKRLDKKQWSELNKEFQETPINETWKLFQKLVEIFKPLQMIEEENKKKGACNGLQ